VISREPHSPRLLVVGDLMIDHYLRGVSQRISPEAPVPVVDVQRETVTLGGAGNVVDNLLALGAQVDVASAVGADSDGEQVRAMVTAKDVSTEAILADPGRTTSRKTRILAGHQQVVRYDRESRAPIDGRVELALLEKIQGLSGQIDAVLLSDYNKGVLTPGLTQGVVRWARSQSIPVLADPKGTNYAKYCGATAITPNRREATLLTGVTIDSDDALRRAGWALKKALAVEYVIITLSEEGMAVFGESMTHISAVAREVYDVTGAGDTVLATLGFCLASGTDMAEAARFANSAAAVVVGKLGSATATVDEILAYEDAHLHDDTPPAVHSPEAIQRIAKQLHQQGRKVVLTNGCFDLLHRGHVQYLQASRACGDRLIVAVNSDASVRRLKGPERPVVGESDRAYLLAALSCVDYVVVFDADTPYELIRCIEPDVLTKGGDYTAREQVVGHDLVDDVRIISVVEGQSTTRTIDRIQRAA
jgi:D-beta-D-heptose 7-phosphate kinase/D-beta-D-heptose 1-phosphate adenosyltransferase